MVEKKHSRISVRVPQSWIRTCREKGISISFVTRAALFQAMNQSTIPLDSEVKLRSKQLAAAYFHKLKSMLVRTITPENHKILCESAFKMILFRNFCMKNPEPGELIALGEFLGQGEYAEAVLQDVYHD